MEELWPDNISVDVYCVCTVEISYSFFKVPHRKGTVTNLGRKNQGDPETTSRS